MKTITLLILVTGTLLMSCKKYEDYRDVSLPKTTAYFASFQEYTRTVVVGEGMEFKIGAAMSGATSNTEDRLVEFSIGNVLYKTSANDNRLLFPGNLYNASQLGTKISTVIPKGEFLGYFSVKMDSVNFLEDSLSLTGRYTLPVKIVGTSLDSIAKGLDSIKVSVKYMSTVDGFYLYKNVIRKEVGGVIIEAVTQVDSAINEADNSAWRMLTQGPFKVRVNSAVTAFTNGLSFNLLVDANKSVTYESISGQPDVTPENTNTYDSKTRDFVLNYHYKKPTVADTIYHVSSQLMFRNRLRDRLNETREYLSYFNK